jgi:multiple sugar transport system ATP-binding protein
MGLRLEDITPQDENANLPAEWTVDAMTEVIEPLGNETHMHLDLEGIKITGRCSGRKKIMPNEKIKLAMNLNNLHIFDAQTQKAISAKT